MIVSSVRQSLLFYRYGAFYLYLNVSMLISIYYGTRTQTSLREAQTHLAREKHVFPQAVMTDDIFINYTNTPFAVL